MEGCVALYLQIVLLVEEVQLGAILSRFWSVVLPENRTSRFSFLSVWSVGHG